MIPREFSWRPTPEEINDLPQRSYTGRIQLICSSGQWEQALPDLLSERVLGFDTETKPTFCKGKTHNPALIQFATSRKVCLIQLNLFHFGKECAKILENPSIIKAGAGINEDISALSKLYPFNPQGMVDIGEFAKSLLLPNHGLRTLAASLFGWRISKGAQCSNWNARVLSRKQIVYAATDAWISRLIYLKLIKISSSRITFPDYFQ